MNLLKEGISQQAVIRTSLSRKITIGGVTRPYPVYKVKLEWLFYNDQNDRIATWISQYKSQHGGQSPSTLSREEFNDIIEDFIVSSNPEALRKTQTNIELVEQREPGVVLSDGRIIDGNRRFTCLRRLHAQHPDSFAYFETVILDQSIESNAKQIKMLELSIQHGEESRVEYNPIDRLVGVYNDTIATQLLTVSEYAKSTNETESEVKKRIEIANLMVEFLEFCNAPLEFHIARDLQVYFPLEELLRMLKKCKSQGEKDALKLSVFHIILMKSSGDMTRYIRKIGNILGSESQDVFLREQVELAERTQKQMPPVGEVTTQTIKEGIRNNEPMIASIESSMEQAENQAKRNETRNRPIQLVEKATVFLQSMDTHILLKMNDSELRRLKRQLELLEESIAEIRKNLP